MYHTAMRKSKKKTAPKKKPAREKSRDPVVTGFVLLCFSLTALLSLISTAYHPPAKHLVGSMGLLLGRTLHGLLGIPGYFAVIFFLSLGWNLLFRKPVNQSPKKFLYLMSLIASLGALLSLIEHEAPFLAHELESIFYPAYQERSIHPHLGGTLMYYIYKDMPIINLSKLLSVYGVLLVSLAAALASFFLLFDISPSRILDKLKTLWPKKSEPINVEESLSVEISPPPYSETRFVKLKTTPLIETTKDLETMMIKPETNLTERPSISRKAFGESFIKDLFKDEEKIPEAIPLSKTKKDLFKDEEKIPEAMPFSKPKQERIKKDVSKSTSDTFEHYKLPPLSLLTQVPKTDSTSLKKDLRRQAEVLEETLSSFGIEAKVGQINCGPTINSFEVHPAIGVKVQRIKALENDIALNMEAKSIRIIAPIPGKAAVGIEIPNPCPQEVSFKEMMQAYASYQKKFHIPILLGKSVSGEWVLSDLAKMPHLIIAGATGSGKSVCINTIVMSILMTAKPDEIKLLMVDPKKVELTGYTKLPHMLAPVINEPFGACQALKWLVREMERRYDILKLLGLRNIQSFNQRTINEEQESALEVDIPKKLPFIVGIIDELADLMMAASQDIETPIARIAQMARAVGIHLILATQRPSREVITGLIKANFPTRIAFKVASRINSQIILDEVGADSLLGNGDMLFLPPGTSVLTRAQGAYVRDEDILSVVQFIAEQASARYEIASFDYPESSQDDGGGENGEEEGNDELFKDAKDVIVKTGNASTTFLQRKLKIGYARAASLMDEMEARGIVGPQEGSKPRKILVKANLLGVEDLEEDIDTL